MASSHHRQTSSSMELSLARLPIQDNISVVIERNGEITPKLDIAPIASSTPTIQPNHNKPHPKSRRKESKNKNKKSHKNGRGHTKKDKICAFSPISQIEIYDIIYDDDIECKLQSTNSLQHSKKMENENDFNFNLLRKTKRPFYILIFLSVLFIALLMMNFVQILKHFLFDGLTPSILAVMSLLPLFFCFKYFENNLIFQHEIISKKIMQTYSLKKKLQIKTNLNLKQKTYIDDLKQLIREQEIQIDKLSKINGNDSQPIIGHKLNLLHGFRRGQMEIQIEFAEINELINMLNIVVSCITLLPFGMTNYRTKLKRILEGKIERNKYLEMHFYFFLCSYLQCVDVKRLFGKHRIMRKVQKTAEFYRYNVSTNGAAAVDECKLEHGAACGSMTPYGKTLGNNTPYNYNQATSFRNESILPTYNVVDINRLNVNAANIVYFGEKDPIKLFRSPLDHFAKVGFTVIVPPELQHRFFDPINGNHCVQQLKVRSVFNSAARPYLIDCYVKNKLTDGKTNILSSSFILKKGDDLRKDQAVLQMFEFMNYIWRENDMSYSQCNVSCLIYKVIPLTNEIGIIEMISDCIELNKILSLKTTLFTAHFLDNMSVRNKFHRLIASSAGSFIASFVCGIRDRHDENILINVEKCILFHIDYGYIFNNKVSLDTARIAITSDLKKIFDLDKHGWADFVRLCVDSWMILRVNANELIDFARVVFAFLYQANEIELFLRDSLKLDMTNGEAQKYITNKIQNAPKQWKTKMKNLVHGFAQKIRTKSECNVSKVAVDHQDNAKFVDI